MKYIFLLLLIFSFNSFAQKTKTIYKYKQYEQVDLGDMDVKGKIIAPGDISVKERKRKEFNTKHYFRRSFSEFIKKEIKMLR
jgi:hypothetical protein